MSSEHVTEVTDQNFDIEIGKADKPVLVDFWAPWCGPCRMIAPIIDEIAKEKSDSVKVCKINVDENPEVATKFRIQAIPAVFIFKSGEVVEKFVGMTSKANILSRLDGLGG